MGAVGKTPNALRHVESEQNEFDTGGLGSRKVVLPLERGRKSEP